MGEVNALWFNIPTVPDCPLRIYRLLGFGACLIGAAVCFFVAFWTLPLLAIRPSKFALAFRYFVTIESISAQLLIFFYSLGSILVMFGCVFTVSYSVLQLKFCALPRFSVLIGPVNHIKHLISKERLPFSFVYFTSLGLTLYFSLGVRMRLTQPLLSIPILH